MLGFHEPFKSRFGDNGDSVGCCRGGVSGRHVFFTSGSVDEDEEENFAATCSTILPREVTFGVVQPSCYYAAETSAAMTGCHRKDGHG